jgi:SrtB family sortase
VRYGSKRRLRRTLGIALATLSLLICAAVLLLAVHIMQEADAYSDISREAHDETEDGSETAGENGEHIDWDVLLKANPDVVGWLRVEGTTIDYPVVKPADHDVDYYLDHDLWGSWSRTGCLVLDEQCEPDDARILIYGHHLTGSSLMFSELADTWKQERFDRLGSCLWSTQGKGTLEFRPYCGARVLNDDAHYAKVSSGASAQSWSEESIETASAKAEEDDTGHVERTITLVTCSSGRSGGPWRCATTFALSCTSLDSADPR